MRDYCCCAIPVVNVGIYATIATQFLAAFIVGVLSVATPSIVGAATPSFAPWVLAAICFAISAIQILGLIGVAKEKPILYRRYVTLHGLAISAAFSVAAAWIILSATRHTTAKTRCLSDFFSSSNSNSEGNALCEIFPWVDIGVMGGIWVVLAILQGYLYLVLSSYGSTQRYDHEKYHQINNESIPMNRRGDPWDARLSTDFEAGDNAHRHSRQESASEMLAQPQLNPRETFDSSYRPEFSPPRNQTRRLSNRGGDHIQTVQE